MRSSGAAFGRLSLLRKFGTLREPHGLEPMQARVTMEGECEVHQPRVTLGYSGSFVPQPSAKRCNLKLAQGRA